jgi:kumamolisin
MKHPFVSSYKQKNTLFSFGEDMVFRKNCLKGIWGRLLFVFLLFTLAACDSGTNQAQQTSTPSPTLQLTAFNLGIPQQALQSPITGNLADSTKLHVIVTFKPNAQLLKQLGSQQKNQNGQGTDVANLANQLGITNQQYQQMESYFGVQNISLNLNKLHTSMTLDANAGAFAKLLQTHFVYHSYLKRTFFAPETPILLPQNLAGYVKAITGLDSYSVPPKPLGAATTFQPFDAHTNQAGCVANENVIFPWQLRQAYGFNQLYNKGWTGKGTTIILPELGLFSRSDVEHYFSCVSFRGKLSVVNVDNAPPTQNDIEPLLDLEMVAGLLPDANIVVYQTDAGGSNYPNFWIAMQDILNQISSDYSNFHHPAMVSVSWGGPEDYLSQGTLNSIDSTLQTMTQVEHLSVFASSGDCGAYASRSYPNGRDVSFPASDPLVTAVGGTNLSVDGNGKRVSENVWQGNPNKPSDCENEWGSGGGLSSFFQQPSWQQGVRGLQSTYSNGMRQVPDVAAVSNMLAGYFNGQWGYLYGTSAATPIWASGFALVNQGLIAKTGYYVNGANMPYMLAHQYTSDRPFYDVVKGNNLYYPATAGWDFATGLGTPNLGGIYQGLLTYIHTQG